MNRLRKLLKPTSVAIIGASQASNRAGYIVMKNLLQGGFQGAIMPVTPKYKSVCGVLAYREVQSLPIVPDLAILCTHASRNIQLFDQIARKGVGATYSAPVPVGRPAGIGPVPISKVVPPVMTVPLQSAFADMSSAPRGRVRILCS